MSFFALIILGIIAYAIYVGTLLKKTILSHWHHRYDEPPFSSNEFYTRIKELLQTKGIRYVSYSNVVYSEGGLLSANREYLRIKYKEFVFDICAAPFGTGYFVSWWLGEMGDPIRDLLINLPIFGKLFKKRQKTFFEHDTAIMFKETVGECVKEAIEQLTNTKGLRNLAEADLKEYNLLH
jgi:hypothetical protein